MATHLFQSSNKTIQRICCKIIFDFWLPRGPENGLNVCPYLMAVVIPRIPFSRGNSRYSAILMKIAATRDLTEIGGITSRYTAIFEFFRPFLGPVQKQ